MLIQHQKDSHCICQQLFSRNADLDRYFKKYQTEECLREMAVLLRDALGKRINEVGPNHSRVEIMKKDKEMITSKVTQVTQQPTIQPVKRYGKPRVRLNGETQCVIHSIQQCLSEKQFKRSGLEPENSKKNVKQLCSISSETSIFRTLGIDQNVSLKINPVAIENHQKQPSNKHVGKTTTQNKEKDVHSSSNEAIRVKHQRIKLLQVQNCRLVDKLHRLELELQRYKHKLKKKQSREVQQNIICCNCCSDDEQVIQKLQKMYLSINNAKKQRERGRKTYKITSNIDYPITSSDESH